MNTKKLFDLSDKVIIITGAAGNLGSQYAEGLSEVGANIVLGDLDYTKCKQLSTKLKIVSNTSYGNFFINYNLLYIYIYIINVFTKIY